jgi:hypothetical protein
MEKYPKLRNHDYAGKHHFGANAMFQFNEKYE